MIRIAIICLTLLYGCGDFFEDDRLSNCFDDCSQICNSGDLSLNCDWCYDSCQEEYGSY